MGDCEKKVVIVLPHFKGGGVERVISLISKYAPKHVNLAFVLFEPEIKYLLRGRLYVIGKYNSIFKLLRKLIDLYRILLSEKPDAILGCEKGRNLVILSFGFRRFIRMESYPGIYLRTSWARFIHAVKMILYRKVTKMITVSHKMKETFVNKYHIPSGKIVTIYNPCDISQIKSLSEERIEPELSELFKKPVIVNVGRIVRQKGQWHLIRAFSLINREFPDSRLVIVGDGPLRAYLEKLIIKLDLQNKALILGFKSNPFKYMKKGFIFALPSLVEGFPNVIVEALACGLPIMAADCLSGPREILNPGTPYRYKELLKPEYGEYGILMPVMDGRFYSADDPLTWQEMTWAHEIIKCLDNPKLLDRYREKAVKRAEEFDARKQVKKYFEVLLRT